VKLDDGRLIFAPDDHSDVIRAGEAVSDFESTPDFESVAHIGVAPVYSGLRFQIGAMVRCNLGAEGWQLGTVVATNYKESEWEDGVIAPYQIKLGDGRLVFAPADHKDIIRAAEV
jgi:hypothetical protein